MKVYDLGLKATYRWRVEVPYNNKTLLNDVVSWIEQNQIKGGVVPGLAFFHDERDVIRFILMWS
jgi:hypothetical protein